MSKQFVGLYDYVIRVPHTQVHKEAIFEAIGIAEADLPDGPWKKFDGNPVLVATIWKGPTTPHLIDGQAFQRIGDRAVPITSDALYDSIRERATDSEDLLKEMKRLSERFEELNKELVAAKSWQSRMLDWILGGIVGALISILLTILLGVG